MEMTKTKASSGACAAVSGSKKRKWRKLDKAIYAVGDPKVIYFRIMVNGKRESLKSPLQGAAAVGANGKPTRELQKLALDWRYKLMNHDYYEQRDQRAKIPSFAKLIELYQEAAAAERIKSGRPEPRTVESAVKYFRYLVAGCGFDLHEPITKMKTEDIDRYIVATIKAGKKPVSAWTYASSAQGVIPRWALEYYRREGYEVRPYQMPMFRNRKPARYERPSAATLEAIRAWYGGLWREADEAASDKSQADGRAPMKTTECRDWFFATMMYKFAMRNGDTARISLGNFVDRDGTTYLCYTPHKTSHSSGTVVNWPVNPSLMTRIRSVAEALGIEDDDEPFVPSDRAVADRVNRQLRRIPGLADKEKACYELRKICVDGIYHDFGVEMAAAISGDDIKTLTYYYADTSHVNVSEALLSRQV